MLWAVIEGRGRRPSHTFLDYAITYLLTAVVLAFTLGQVRQWLDGSTAALRCISNERYWIICMRGLLHSYHSAPLKACARIGYCAPA